MKTKPSKTPAKKTATPEPVKIQRRKVLHMNGRGQRRMRFADEV